MKDVTNPEKHAAPRRAAADGRIEICSLRNSRADAFAEKAKLLMRAVVQ